VARKRLAISPVGAYLFTIRRAPHRRNMIRVHHLNNSRSQRVLWLLEELGVPYEIVRYERDKATMLAPPELKRVHPLGKSPVIEDDGKKFAETGLIIEYIVERYGPDLMPPRDSDYYWRYKYWLHYAEGSLMPPLLLKLVVGRLGLLGLPAKGFVNSQLQLHLDYLETELGKALWFASEAFSAADIMLSFPLEAATHRAGLDETRPKLTNFLKHIHARPAYRRALAKGGAYRYAE
jgi:glutathione S-transferase